VGWNPKGKPQPTETYTWILVFKDTSGNTIKKSGRSVLIRYKEVYEKPTSSLYRFFWPSSGA
jgi:hypothetical protein